MVFHDDPLQLAETDHLAVDDQKSIYIDSSS